MKTSDFYYDLPQELIAQDPLEDRSSSRLMHLSLKDGSIEHRHFTDVLDYMEEGDCLVINDTKVIPARLYGHKEETGALIEILLLKRRENDIWECLVKPGKKARPGAKITFGNGILKGKIIDEAIGLSAVIINETVGDKINKANAAINYLNDLNDAYDENNKNIIYDEEKWRNEFNDFYYLQTPKELLKSKCGICWDQVELERELFKNTKFKYETYFIYLNDNNMLPSHTFLVYQNNNNYYWFEHSWNKYMGVHQYKSMKKLYEDVKNKFVKENNYVSKNATFGMYLYEKPKKHIKCMEFYDYVVTGKKINI